MMNIGNIKLKHGLMLAPMAGVTDFAFRSMAKEYGAEYMVTEMISAKAIHYGDKKTELLAAIDDFERPTAIQIFGSEPDIMAEAAHTLETRYRPDAIDINMGCPVHKIVGNGEGSALMKNASLAAQIVKSVKSAVELPVTVKIRSGWDSGHQNAVEFAAALQEAGADAVCIHGRTKEQMYTPPVNLDIIRDVKNALDIPVIGNGAVNSAADALQMLEYTGCDGIMVARGAYGNPFIFEEILCALENKKYTPPTYDIILDTATRHIEKLISDKGHIGILEARKHIAWYIKGFDGAASVRGHINAAVTADQINAVIGELRGKLN